jgi:HlyD family secretion protein
MEIPPLEQNETECDASRSPHAKSVRRNAGRSRLAYCALSLFVLMLLAGGLLWISSGRKDTEIKPVLVRAERAPFVHEIFVQGNVQSSVNTEVVCKVEWHDGWWPVILDVVEEGTFVEKGDVLMRIETSKLDDMIRDSEAECRDMEAWKVRATSRLEVAEMNLTAFEEGRRELELTKRRNALALAKEDFRIASRDLELTESLYELGYLTERQLEATQLAAMLSNNELEAAQLDVDVLGTYTHARQLLELTSEISAAEENLASAEEVLRVVTTNHERLVAELDNCVISAPIEGYVVLNHLHHSDHSHWIKIGEKIRPEQAVIKLPDPRFMQVEAYLTETETPLVKPGQKVSMTFDAYSGLALPGVVESVSSFAEETAWYGPKIKRYKTIITIDRAEVERTEAPLRPGLTARVEILVNSASPCLQIPIQAVIHHGEEDFCLTYEDGRIDSRRIDAIQDNGMFVIVRSGLEEGESIVMAAELYRDEVKLPPLPEVEDIADETDGLADLAPPSNSESISGQNAPGIATRIEPVPTSSTPSAPTATMTGHAAP